ncbi:MAG: hypothetical protein WBB39_02135 [Candidatus Saccharimonadales bacterium]
MSHYADLIRRRVVAWVGSNQLLSGILAVIAITVMLTGISMALYITSGASGLDLSRPGFNASRNTVTPDETPTFSATGKLTSQDIETFTKLYNAQRDKLKQIGSFDDQALTDEALGLVMPADEPVPGNE